MEKYNVEYKSGETADTEHSKHEYCDYMLADVERDGETIRLYAEVDPNDYGYDEGKNEKWNELSTYDDLKAMIIKQAEENNIDPACLTFWFD